MSAKFICNRCDQRMCVCVKNYFCSEFSHLLDLRFADDIVTFTETENEFVDLTNMLVECLKEVGLCLNASKRNLLQVSMCKF